MINLFTFSIIDVKEGTVSINIEDEGGELSEIKRRKFQIKNVMT